MLTLGLGATAALVLLAVSVRLLEQRFAFFPVPGESVTQRDLGVRVEPLTVCTRDGQQLHVWSLGGREGRARILYCHGNGGNLSIWAPILAGLARRGISVFAADYRGYGLSTGRPSEQGLYRDVDAVVERFWRDISTDAPVLYWGRSLGVAMAAYAATRRKPDGLILESGFPNARSLLRGSALLTGLALFSTYRFPTDRFLERLGSSVPVLVLHGDHDRVVPIEQGRALYEGVAGPKRFVTIRGGDHNDVSPSDPQQYWQAVDEFIDSLGKRRR